MEEINQIRTSLRGQKSYINTYDIDTNTFIQKIHRHTHTNTIHYFFIIFSFFSCTNNKYKVVVKIINFTHGVNSS